MTRPSNPREGLAILIAAAADGRLDLLCETFEVRVLSAFGSAIRHTPALPNDLDIGVSFRGASKQIGQYGARVALWDALVDLTGCEAIDVVVLDVDNPILRAEALTGVPLYEREAGDYAEAQIAAVGEARDTAHLRRRNLELMAS